MNKMCSITALSFFFAVMSAHGADSLEAFPPAEEGMVRYILQPPNQDDESIFKVEMVVGKTVNAVSVSLFLGTISPSDLKSFHHR